MLPLEDTIAVGFTGTRRGVTAPQKEALEVLLGRVLPMDEFHHGDCVGADSDAHAIVRSLRPRVAVVVHPPSDGKLRAWCEGHVMRDPKPYRVRNQNIVDGTTTLVAAPALGSSETPFVPHRGGTWMTIRKALIKGREVRVVWPDGSVSFCFGDNNAIRFEDASAARGGR